MSYFNDALTIGLVLILLFGSIALFLYTRMTQSEQKISVLESIILDIKMASEIKSYSELPMDEMSPPLSEAPVVPVVPVAPAITPVAPITYPSFDEIESTVASTVPSSTLPLYPPFEESVEESEHPSEQESQEMHVIDMKDYDSMSLKELQAVARSRGLSTSGVKKNALIDALKSSDEQQTVLPLSMNTHE